MLAFGFHQPSYFVSLGLFIWLYSMTVDVPLRIGLNYFSRYLEERADSFSVRQGFGVSMRNSLVRSAAKNLDNLFLSHIDVWLNHTHPDLFERLDNVEKVLGEDHGELREKSETYKS